MSRKGMRRMTGVPPCRSSFRDRGGTRGRYTRNKQYEKANPVITKRQAAEVVTHRPEWIVNALYCTQQIDRHQGITLTGVLSEMKTSMKAAIKATVYNCKTIHILASEDQNPLGRSYFDKAPIQIQPNHALIPDPFDTKQDQNILGHPTNNKMNKELRTQTALTNQKDAKSSTRKQEHGTLSHHRSPLQKLLDGHEYAQRASPCTSRFDMEHIQVSNDRNMLTKAALKIRMIIITTEIQQHTLAPQQKKATHTFLPR